MPGADAASFSARARADLILGIRRPRSAAHARLMQIETWLRYAVPGLIATFLMCLAGVAALYVMAYRDDVTTSAQDQLEEVSRLAAAALAGSVQRGDALERLKAILPAAPQAGRAVVVAGPDDRIIAVYPPLPAAATNLTDLIGEDQPLAILGERAGAMTLRLVTGEDAIVAVHRLDGGEGVVAVLQPLSEVTAGWWLRMRSQALLLLAASIVIVGIGIAYSLQTRRAHEADGVCELVRHRSSSP